MAQPCWKKGVCHWGQIPVQKASPTSSLFSLLCANIQDMIFEVPVPDALLPAAMPLSHNVMWDFPLYAVIAIG